MVLVYGYLVAQFLLLDQGGDQFRRQPLGTLLECRRPGLLSSNPTPTLPETPILYRNASNSPIDVSNTSSNLRNSCPAPAIVRTQLSLTHPQFGWAQKKLAVTLQAVASTSFASNPTDTRRRREPP